MTEEKLIRQVTSLENLNNQGINFKDKRTTYDCGMHNAIKLDGLRTRELY